MALAIKTSGFGNLHLERRAVRRGFEFDYVLFDSWFFSKEVLARVKSFRTKDIKLIAMVKMGKNL